MTPPTALLKPFSQTGLYLHIPFCHARCGYCDFVTFTGKDDQIERYVETLCAELRLLVARYPDVKSLSTIFLGGGTPSVLSPDQLAQIFDTAGRYWALSAAEITIEANPESTSPDQAAAWRRLGINRVSLGLQSFDDELLKKMGRLHSAAGFRSAYAAVRAAGFDNVNIDLIYGFEGQSLQNWQDTVHQALGLLPEHVSFYALTVEPHTPFAAQGHRTDGDAQAGMYEWAREAMNGAGLSQYEISNFAVSGRECRHNLLYWRQQNYLAAGVGAVGCVRGTRWQVSKNLSDYFAKMKQLKLPWESAEDLPVPVQQFERLMLGLRLREGLAWDPGENAAWERERVRLAQQGLLEETRPGVWRIPDRSVALTNQVLLAFL
jgi:oxygen-independent coproporphyrinogen-3 oxidase